MTRLQASNVLKKRPWRDGVAEIKKTAMGECISWRKTVVGHGGCHAHGAMAVHGRHGGKYRPTLYFFSFFFFWKLQRIFWPEWSKDMPLSLSYRCQTCKRHGHGGDACRRRVFFYLSFRTSGHSTRRLHRLNLGGRRTPSLIATVQPWHCYNLFSPCH